MDYWQKQETEPLFPDLLWSRPENKRQAGKLLIIGGNIHAFSAPGVGYDEAAKAGIGTAKVLLPEGLKKTLGNVLENCEFAPMNKSGSFAKTALAEWLDWAQWSDCVLLAGDVGRNSETAIVSEQFVQKYAGQLVVTQDVFDQFKDNPELLFNRDKTAIVISFSQLQKVWPKLTKGKSVLQYSKTLAQSVEALHDYSKNCRAHIITKHHDDLIVAVNGHISTTKNIEEIWRVSIAAKSAVWWLQNPSQSFMALTMACWNNDVAVENKT